jgi:hypothetical protein
MKTKAIVPIFIALIFIGSIFVVFARGGGGVTGSTQLTVQYSGFYGPKQKDIQLYGNISAFDLLNEYVNFKAVAGKATCITYPPKEEYTSQTQIIDICNNNKTEWVFYVNGVSITENAEQYIVTKNDKITFSYEVIKKSAVNESSINETI